MLEFKDANSKFWEESQNLKMQTQIFGEKSQNSKKQTENSEIKSQRCKHNGKTYKSS